MVQLFFAHKYYMLAVFVLFAASISCQIILGILLKKLIYETEKMATTENKSLKQMKRKYMNCMELNDGIPNVTVFVDKYLQKLKWNVFSLSKMKHLSGQLVLLGVVVAGIGACGAIADEKPFSELLPFYLVTFLGIYIYLAISSLIDLEGKKEHLKTNLVDYLENHQGKKLKRMELDMEHLNKVDPDELDKEVHTEETNLEMEKSEEELLEGQAKELCSLLRELLI